MFGNNYFGQRYFGDRYFGQGTDPVSVNGDYFGDRYFSTAYFGARYFGGTPLDSGAASSVRRVTDQGLASPYPSPATIGTVPLR